MREYDLIVAKHLPDVPGLRALFYRGSIAHGMYVPSSDPDSIDDIDLIGLVIPESQHYLGLTEWRSGHRGTQEIVAGCLDIVIYELRKMVRLILQGNPNVLSFLWTDPSYQYHFDSTIKPLVDNRRLFAGKHVYNPFIGYARAQMEKMESRDPTELREYLAVTAELKRRGLHPNHKGEVIDSPERDSGIERDVACWTPEKLLARLRHYQKKGENIGYMGEKRKRLVLEHGHDSKNAAHLIRLLRMGREFLETGELRVLRPDAEELLRIKRGEFSLKEVKELA